MTPLRLAFIAALMAFISPALAAEGFVSQKGQWIVNKAETKVPADAFIPPEAPMVVSDDDGKALKFIVYALSADLGLQPDISFDGAYDGQAYAYGKDGSRSFKHISPNSFRSDWKSNDGQSASEVVTFAAGNTKMRIEGKRVGKDGKTYDYVQVWDRLQ